MDSIAEEFRFPEPGQTRRAPETWGAGDAYCLASWARTLAPRRVVVLTAQPADAERLIEELGWFDPALKLQLFPDWETLPYDHFSPHQDLISERLQALWRMLQRDIDLLVAPMTTASLLLPPRSLVAGRSFVFGRGEQLKRDALASQLVEAGYEHVSQVVKPGEYCIRGSLIDLFPMGNALPLRIDLLDDLIDSIKSFDPDTQRSLFPVPSVRILPGREFPLDEESRNRFRARWRDRFEGDPTRCNVYKDIGSGLAPGGVEWYLPLFYESCNSLFDYTSKDDLIV